jgi:hypothetical protein
VRKCSVRSRRTWPPPVHGSKARCHRGKWNAVLTTGPMGPGGEGVGEEVRDAVTRKAAALVGEAERRRGEEEVEEAGGRRRARLPQVWLLLALHRAPPFSSSSPPSPSPPACRCVDRGLNPPRRLGLGELWGLRWRLLIGEARCGARGRRRRSGGARSRIATVAMNGATGLWHRRQPKW